MNFFSYAIRNLYRARQRTIIMILAMAFAGFIMIFYAALMEGFLDTTEKNAIGMDTGQFQIHAKGYRQDPDLYKTIANPSAIIDQLAAKGYQASPRLYSFALAAAGSSSAGVMLRGIDLKQEALVTTIHKHLREGSWLSEDQQAGVVIGSKLARNINVGINDEIVIVGQAADGSMANELYNVRGILKSVGEAIDRGGFFMTREAFSNLMIIDGECHEIVIIGPADSQLSLQESTEELAAMFSQYEVKNWRQLHPVLARIIDMTTASLIFMLIVTYAAVAILTLNGMLMNVFERIREFGIIKALGMPPWQIFTIIVVEALLQVSISSILAIAGAVPLSLYCQTHPLDLTSLSPDSSSIAGIAFDPYWHSHLTINSILLPVLFMFIFTILAIIYPACKASLIRPLKAIYHR